MTPTRTHSTHAFSFAQAVADVALLIGLLNQDANCNVTPEHRQNAVHIGASVVRRAIASHLWLRGVQ